MADKKNSYNPFFSMFSGNQGMLSVLQQMAPKRVTKWQSIQEQLKNPNLSQKQINKLTQQSNKLSNAIGNKVFNPNNPAGLTMVQDFLNKQQAQDNFKYNNPNETDAYGNSITNKIDPVTGEVTRNVTLSEAEQKRLNDERGRDSLYNEGINKAYADYNSAPSLTNDFSADRQRIEDQLYSRFKTRADERYSQDQQNIEQSLLQRGVPVGSELWTKEMGRFGQEKNDAYQGAMFDAVRSGGDEQQNMWNMQLQRRNQPLSEISTFTSNSSGVKNPNFTQFAGTNYNAPDFANLGQQFANMANQYKISQEQNATTKYGVDKNNATQMAIATMNNASRGASDSGFEVDAPVFRSNRTQSSAPKKYTNWFGSMR